MLMEDIVIGEEYAYRVGSYGNPVKVKALETYCKYGLAQGRGVRIERLTGIAGEEAIVLGSNLMMVWEEWVKAKAQQDERRRQAQECMMMLGERVETLKVAFEQLGLKSRINAFHNEIRICLYGLEDIDTFLALLSQLEDAHDQD